MLYTCCCSFNPPRNPNQPKQNFENAPPQLIFYQLSHVSLIFINPSHRLTALYPFRVQLSIGLLLKKMNVLIDKRKAEGDYLTGEQKAVIAKNREAALLRKKARLEVLEASHVMAYSIFDESSLIK